jgi:hypothetical protein
VENKISLIHQYGGDIWVNYICRIIRTALKAPVLDIYFRHMYAKKPASGYNENAPNNFGE